MAATVIIESCHGATVGGAPTDVTGAGCRFKLADNDTVDLNNPIPKPAASNTWSWRKSFRIKVTATPDGSISNLKWFTDGLSWGTGVTLRAHSRPVANYTQASASDESAVIATGGGSSVVDAATLTSGAYLSMNSGGTILSNPSTGYGTQDLFECQLEVASTASHGIKPSSGSRVITARFDEV